MFDHLNKTKELLLKYEEQLQLNNKRQMRIQLYEQIEDSKLKTQINCFRRKVKKVFNCKNNKKLN